MPFRYPRRDRNVRLRLDSQPSYATAETQSRRRRHDTCRVAYLWHHKARSVAQLPRYEFFPLYRRRSSADRLYRDQHRFILMKALIGSDRRSFS